MEECTPTLNTGLRGVIVASTKISQVDGKAGKLIYRGYLAKDLAEKTTFEEVIFLLLKERLPDRAELDEIRAALGRARQVAPETIAALRTQPRDARPMDILQAAVSLLATHDPDIDTYTREASVARGIRLIARFPTILCAWARLRQGLEPLTPLPELGHAANFLYMLTGSRPDEELTRFFDACLVLHAEHSFNASTFTARQVASTQAHMYAAVSAAVGSLSGPLHGGANERVMQMLLEIGSADKVEAYVERMLAEGRLIYGLGHAVYQVDDPRAHILAPMSRTMGERIGQTQWYEISRRLETAGKAAFKKRKGVDIFVNVDFYSASLYYAMGIPIDYFTPIFAVSRVAGWVAHILEEQFAEAAPKPQLYRPAARYVGEYCGPDECTLDAIDKRR
ncbi:MAG: citrate/2-methylcitrate synthase [Desulfobacterales bacterium]